jgi:hypothetical protein
MPAIEAHPTATGPSRPRTTAMRATVRMSLAYADATRPSTLSWDS